MKGQLEASKAETNSVMDQLQSLKNNQQMIGESALLESLQNSHQQEKEQLLNQHAEERLAMTSELDQIRAQMEEDSLTGKLKVVELQNQVDAL